MNTKRTIPLILTVLAALVLTACAGEPTPTATPEPPTAEAATPAGETPTETPLDMPTAEPTVNSPFPTLEIVVYPTIVETPFPTNDPSISALPTEEIVPPPPGFDRIILIRRGGPTLDDGTTADLIITLERDGRISRGEAQGRVNGETIELITELIDRSQFFTVDANFLGPVPAEPPLPFLYDIVVTSGVYERRISAQEGFMSVPIQQLIGTVLDEGQRVGAP